MVTPTLLAERFFLASPLVCTLSFACLVLHVAGLFTSPRDGDVNKPATRNTRHMNNNDVHAKGLARKKRSASRVGYPQFSFWIPKALAKFCFLCIVLNHAKNICVLVGTTYRKPEYLKVRTVLKLSA